MGGRRRLRRWRIPGDGGTGDGFFLSCQGGGVDVKIRAAAGRVDGIRRGLEGNDEKSENKAAALLFSARRDKLHMIEGRV
jgi:hypothetical protein